MAEGFDEGRFEDEERVALFDSLPCRRQKDMIEASALSKTAPCFSPRDDDRLTLVLHVGHDELEVDEDEPLLSVGHEHRACLDLVALVALR